MAPPVYSTRFIGANILGSGSENYVVPTGFRAIIRELSGEALSPGNFQNPQFTAYVQQIGGAVPIFFEVELPALLSCATVWSGRVIANEGETITAEANTPGSEWSVSIAGYLLSTP